MILRNLTPRAVDIAREIWDIKDGGDLIGFLRDLPLEDRQIARAVIELIKWGGDDVADLREAQLEIDRIRRL
jgi:hypothetical protein